MATAIITAGRSTLISQQVAGSMLVADWKKAGNTCKLILEVDRRLQSHFNWWNTVAFCEAFFFLFKLNALRHLPFLTKEGQMEFCSNFMSQLWAPWFLEFSWAESCQFISHYLPITAMTAEQYICIDGAPLSPKWDTFTVNLCLTLFDELWNHSKRCFPLTYKELFM